MLDTYPTWQIRFIIISESVIVNKLFATEQTIGNNTTLITFSQHSPSQRCPLPFTSTMTPNPQEGLICAFAKCVTRNIRDNFYSLFNTGPQWITSNTFTKTHQCDTHHTHEIDITINHIPECEHDSHIIKVLALYSPFMRSSSKCPSGTSSKNRYI